MKQDLKEKTLVSLASSYSIQFMAEGIRVITRIILARLLMPDDFGLFALAFLILNIGKVFTQLGLGQYIIREERVDYGLLFSLGIAAGVFVFLILGTITPFIYGYNPALPPVHRIIILALLPYSASIVPVTYAYKELRLNKMVIPSVLNAASFAIFAIIFSLKGLGIWALVYAQLISEIIFTGLLWIVFYRSIDLRFHFKMRDIFGLIRGAKYFYALAIFGIFTTGIDKIILGRLVLLKQVGYYAVAMTLAMYPTNIIEPALNNVFYPFFSKIKTDIKKTREFYASATVILYWLEIPLYLFLSFNADIIIGVFLGERWLPAVPFFRLLAILPIIRPCSTFGVQIMQAHSREKIQLYVGLLHFALFLTVGWFTVNQIGALGIIWTQFYIYPLTFIFLYFVNKITRNVISIFIKLFPIYISCLLGLGLVHTIFKVRSVALGFSLLYIMVFYIVYYKCKISPIIRTEFSDIGIFKRLRLP